MSYFLEIMSIFIGRWVLGGIGFWVRRAYYSFFEPESAVKKRVKSKKDDVVDVEEFQNRLIGVLTILIIGSALMFVL